MRSQLHHLLQDTLRPVDKYAVRFLEESGPAFDVAAAAAAAAAGGDGRADWDVEQIQALQEQVLSLRLQGSGTAPAVQHIACPWHSLAHAKRCPAAHGNENQHACKLQGCSCTDGTPQSRVPMHQY